MLALSEAAFVASTPRCEAHRFPSQSSRAVLASDSAATPKPAPKPMPTRPTVPATIAPTCSGVHAADEPAAGTGTVAKLEASISRAVSVAACAGDAACAGADDGGAAGDVTVDAA